MRHRRFEQARQSLEAIFLGGYAPRVLVVAYAVALSELGEDEKAASIAQFVGVDDRLSSAQPYLPGGKRHRRRREQLRDSAERWLPRLKKAKQ